MAEAERVLRELSIVPCTDSDLSLARAMPDCLPLDPGLDFVVHDDGMIELTKAGFRRMGQAHSAVDAVIKIDRRDVFRFPATGGASVTSVNRGESTRPGG
jgi:hypothetical protein